MSTHAINWLNNETPERKPMLPTLSKANDTACYAVKVISVLVVAIALNMIVYMALITPALAPSLHAILTASGFIFLALAIDAENPLKAWSLAATGIALPIFAGLSFAVTPSFTIAAAALVVLWITASILRR